MELTPELQEKKRLMINGLKKTYKVQYDAVQPIPYIKDRLYCVDKVFVEGGVEVCLAPELTRNTGGSWERLLSYKNIYTDFGLNYKRRVIQGEPGYGKSTLTLQLAYDWCNDVWNSSMRNIEILILLRLRQLGGIQSIYRAIKLFLLADERRVSVDDIKQIIQSCSSVNIILDGYDEYPNRDSTNDNDVDKMIMEELFKENDVTVTTRYLPKRLTKKTKRAKLTGFDDKARDKYIRKAVVGENDEAVERIKRMLYENSILADLCQVPLIFVMFAHMAHDREHLMKFTSVTQFFQYMIKCFHEHLRRKFDTLYQDFDIHETEHQKLNRIAFEGLNKENQQLTWEKDTFKERVGQKCYEQYILIGLLVEEQVVSVISIDDTVVYTTEVRFYHKLFCEWYAAQYFVSAVMDASDLANTLKLLDPFDLQYLYRFACGLHPDAGKKLINHLKSSPGGGTFAILCILEQTGDVNDIMDSVKDLCSRDVKIQEGDSALLQRSTTQLLEIASNSNIPVSCLHLECSSIELEGAAIVLQSGIHLPVLPTVEKIHIAGSSREPFTDQDILNLCHYGMKCRRMKELMFLNLQLPTSFPPEALTNIMETLNIQVRWRPGHIDFYWDIQTCDWEVDSIDSLRQLCSETMYFTDEDNILQNISEIQVIRLAYTHDIPVSCLHLEYSSIQLEGDAIILSSGLHLPEHTSFEKINIAGPSRNDDDCDLTKLPELLLQGTIMEFENRKLSEDYILTMLKYGEKGKHFKELMFDKLLLKDFPSTELKEKMNTRDFQVRCRPYKNRFHWDIQKCDWEADDINYLRKLCSETIYIKAGDNVFKQWSTATLIKSASNNNIPISCVYLEKSCKWTNPSSIYLNSAVILSHSVSVKKVVIHTEKGREMDETDLLFMLVYVMKSHVLEELMFVGCMLPPILDSCSIAEEMLSRNIKVFWKDYGYSLNLQSGVWEVADINKFRKHCTGTLKLHPDDSLLVQRCTIHVVENASLNDIPIPSLCLEKSFHKIYAGNIISHSGLGLSRLASVKKVVINTYAEGREMTKKEVVDILKFVQQSHMLEELEFTFCLLPQSIPAKSIPSKLKSKNVKVAWKATNTWYQLNLQSGRWMPTLTREITDREYVTQVKKFREKWRHTEWQKAREASEKK